MPLVSFEGVCKRYRRGGREVVALDDVWLGVEAGEFVGVWGGRRSGKSALLRVAAGIELADAGAVRFAGRDLARLSAGERARLLRREIGFVSPSLEVGRASLAGRGQRVVDYVALPLISAGWDLDDAEVRARHELDRVGAAGCADAAAFELSPGEATRVAIARALVRDPRLLLVDEPATTPSPTERDEVRALVRALGADPGVTLILVSEEVAFVREAARVMSIGDGRLLSTDRPGTVLPFPGGRAARRERPAP